MKNNIKYLYFDCPNCSKYCKIELTSYKINSWRDLFFNYYTGIPIDYNGIKKDIVYYFRYKKLFNLC